MTTPREPPRFASPDRGLRRLTVAVLAWLMAGAVVAQSLPTVLTPLPLEWLAPEPAPVIARTPSAEVQP